MFFIRLYSSASAIGLIVCLFNVSPSWAQEEEKNPAPVTRREKKRKAEEAKKQKLAKDMKWTSKDAPTPEGVQAFLDRTLHASEDGDCPLKSQDYSVIGFLCRLSPEMLWLETSRLRDEFGPETLLLQTSRPPQKLETLSEACNHIVMYCRYAHILNKDSGAIDFFQSPRAIIKYLEDGNVENPQVYSFVYYHFHQLAASFFLNNGDYERALENFLICDSLNPHTSLKQVRCLLAHHLVDNYKTFALPSSLKVEKEVTETQLNTACVRKQMCISLKSTAEFKKAVLMYEKFLDQSSLKEEDDNLDHYLLSTVLYYYSGSYQEALDYAKKALQKSWAPSFEISVPNLTPDQIQNHFMALSHYHLGNFDEALRILSSGISHPEAYLYLTYISINKKEYLTAYEYFLNFRQLKIDYELAVHRHVKNYKFPLMLNEENVLLLLEMALNLDQKKRTKLSTAKDSIINFLIEEIPAMEDKIQELSASLVEKNKRKSRVLVATAIATDKIDKSKRIYETFDRIYTSLWTKASQIDAPDEDFLGPLFNLAERIETIYQNIATLDPTTNHYEITQGYEELTSLQDEFKVEANQVLSNIESALVGARRKLSKTLKTDEGEPKTVALENHSSNLKNEYKGEKGNTKEKTRKKGDESLNTKRPRKQQTSPKGEEPAKECEGMLKGFKCSATREFWESEDSEFFQEKALKEKALELLDDLDNAKSMFHLRMKTRPGTKLEQLEGDREGQLSLRINDEYRICFFWTTGVGAFDIEITKHYKKM